jgi:hypothetical protein
VASFGYEIKVMNMFLLSKINRFLNWVGASPRLYCENFAKDILNRRQCDSIQIQGTDVCGTTDEQQIVKRALNHIFERRPYIWRLVGCSELVVIFGKERPARSDFPGVIYIEDLDQFSVCQVAGLLVLSSVKLRCRKQNVPFTWVSRKRITELGLKYWGFVCKYCAPP